MSILNDEDIDDLRERVKTRLEEQIDDANAEEIETFADLLDETNTRLTSRYLNQDNSFFARPESRYFRLGFKYNFGNFRLSDNQRAIEAQERERL